MRRIERIELENDRTLYIGHIVDLKRLHRKLDKHYIVWSDENSGTKFNIGTSRVYGMLISKTSGGYMVINIMPGDEVLAELFGIGGKYASI